jgi:tRNA A37 threonylcarbamoyladenosine synthetase subunit TsaC/SUA5/YrdC
MRTVAVRMSANLIFRRVISLSGRSPPSRPLRPHQSTSAAAALKELGRIPLVVGGAVTLTESTIIRILPRERSRCSAFCAPDRSPKKTAIRKSRPG